MTHDLPDLHGRTALVTGANKGIGRAVAAGLARAGARTVLLCRDNARGIEACASLSQETGGDLHLVLCDLADQGDVRRCAAEILHRFDALHVLVHNAGAYLKERELTEDGVERMLAVDVVGPWQLNSRLLPLLQDSGGARIVQLAGIYYKKGGIQLDDLSWADRPFDPLAASAAAQLMRVLMTRAWARRLEGSGVGTWAVHPGAVRTDAQKEAPWWAQALMATLLRPGFVDPPEGAAPVLHVATAPVLPVASGGFFRRMEPEPLEGDGEDDALGEQLWAALEALVHHPRHQPPGMLGW